VTGHGLAQNMAQVLPRPLVFGLVCLLFVANTINIGADLAAMGAAAELVVGWGGQLFTVAFALLSLGLQLFVPYVRDMGVWGEGRSYLKGDGVTWGGSFWIAQDDTADKPEASAKSWRLAVKRGRDGKDFAGPQPAAPPKVKVP
jgi:hypothetical protein